MWRKWALCICVLEFFNHPLSPVETQFPSLQKVTKPVPKVVYPNLAQKWGVLWLQSREISSEITCQQLMFRSSLGKRYMEWILWVGLDNLSMWHTGRDTRSDAEQGGSQHGARSEVISICFRISWVHFAVGKIRNNLKTKLGYVHAMIETVTPRSSAALSRPLSSVVWKTCWFCWSTTRTIECGSCHWALAGVPRQEKSFQGSGL